MSMHLMFLQRLGRSNLCHKKRAWEHLTLYGIDLPANDINMKSKDCLQKMCASVLEKRVYLQQQVENGDEDGDGKCFSEERC